MRRKTLLVCAVYVLTALAARADAGRVALTFGDSTVTVTGVTTSGSVYVYGLARDLSGGFVNIGSHSELLRDGDGDGVVQLTLGKELPIRSLWIAVDMDTGTYAAASPDGYAVSRVALSDKELRKPFGADITQVAFRGMLVEFVVVRPKEGAWRFTCGLRGPDDEDDEGDRVAADVNRFHPEKGTSPKALDRLRHGDVVLAVNSFLSEYGISRIGDGPQ